MALDADDRLRLDYDQTTQLLRSLGDIRFRLLAFVPTVAGTTVGLLGQPRPAAELLAVGLLGLVATLGIFAYELRNTQIYDAVVARAEVLERRLALPPAGEAETAPGGLFSERPHRNWTLFGLLTASHDSGLALVYGAALAGWSYLVAWGALRALDVGGARKIGAVVGAIVGVAVAGELARLGRSGR